MQKSVAFQIWRVVYPVGIYYVVSSVAYFVLELFFGEAGDDYMLRQLLCAACTVPFVYSFYREDHALLGGAAGRSNGAGRGKSAGRADADGAGRGKSASRADADDAGDGRNFGGADADGAGAGQHFSVAASGSAGAGQHFSVAASGSAAADAAGNGQSAGKRSRAGAVPLRILDLFLTACAGAFLGFAVNNFIAMTPLIEHSPGFAQANEAFFAGGVALELLGSCLVIPFAEELLYRGVAYVRIRQILMAIPISGGDAESESAGGRAASEQEGGKAARGTVSESAGGRAASAQEGGRAARGAESESAGGRAASEQEGGKAPRRDAAAVMRRRVCLAMAISGLLFGLMHGNVVQLIYAGILGVFLSFEMERSGLLAAFAGHVGANLLAVARQETGFFSFAYEPGAAGIAASALALLAAAALIFAQARRDGRDF